MMWITMPSFRPMIQKMNIPIIWKGMPQFVRGRIILRIVLADIYQTAIFGLGKDMARPFVLGE